MRAQNEFERALLKFENQLGALSVACEKLKVVFVEKHIEVFAEDVTE